METCTNQSAKCDFLGRGATRFEGCSEPTFQPTAAVMKIVAVSIALSCLILVAAAIDCYLCTNCETVNRYTLIIKTFCTECLSARIQGIPIRLCTNDAMKCEIPKKTGKLEVNFNGILPGKMQSMAQQMNAMMQNATGGVRLTDVQCCKKSLCNNAAQLSIRTALLGAIMVFSCFLLL